MQGGSNGTDLDFIKASVLREGFGTTCSLLKCSECGLEATPKYTEAVMADEAKTVDKVQMIKNDEGDTDTQ